MKKTENQETINETQNPEVEPQSENPQCETDTQSEETASASDKMAEELAQCQDRFARLTAEFDNFRKRTAKEKMDLIAGGGERVLKAFLTIADDIERAIKVLPEGAEREGMELIYKKFIDTLKSQNVTPIEAMGEKLDVDFHNAIAKFATGDPQKVDCVIDVVQQGYMLGEKVLRHAQVVVGE
ncbi:MAG: nucleotide exchange factor GrpE [Rikenellaceae bacterium]